MCLLFIVYCVLCFCFIPMIYFNICHRLLACRRLEEMQEYCESRLDCRRKTFARHFGSSEVNTAFPPCETMCDNCLRSGARRASAPGAAGHAKRPQQANSASGSGGFKPAKQLLQETEMSTATATKKSRPVPRSAAASVYSAAAHSHSRDVVALYSSESEGDTGTGDGFTYTGMTASHYLVSVSDEGEGGSSSNNIVSSSYSAGSSRSTNVGKMQFMTAGELLAKKK
jgi:hypothetical protein